MRDGVDGAECGALAGQPGRQDDVDAGRPAPQRVRGPAGHRAVVRIRARGVNQPAAPSALRPRLLSLHKNGLCAKSGRKCAKDYNRESC